jgi:hypothetical protein
MSGATYSIGVALFELGLDRQLTGRVVKRHHSGAGDLILADLLVQTPSRSN